MSHVKFRFSSGRTVSIETDMSVVEVQAALNNALRDRVGAVVTRRVGGELLAPPLWLNPLLLELVEEAANVEE